MRASELLSDITNAELVNMIDICIINGDEQNIPILAQIIRNKTASAVEVIGKLQQRLINN